MVRVDRSAVAAAFVRSAVRAAARDGRCGPPPDDDWVGAADTMGVGPVVLDAVASAGWDLPVGAQALRQADVMRDLRMTVSLSRLVPVLADVTWVLVKGPVLSEVVYRRRAIRRFDDLDVIVDPDELGDALELLEAAGYVLVDRNWRLVADTRRGEVTVLSPEGTVVDLHWHPVNEARTRADLALDVRTLLRDRVWVEVDGTTTPTLSPVDTVLYVALHACLSGAHEMKWLLDFQQAVHWWGGTPAQLAGRADELGLGPAVAVVAHRAAQHLDAGLAELACELAPRSFWVRGCAALSRRSVPGAPRGHSGRLVFASTRSTTARSAQRLLEGVAVSLRDRVPALDRSVPASTLHAPGGDPDDRRRWVAQAAGEGQTTVRQTPSLRPRTRRSRHWGR